VCALVSSKALNLVAADIVLELDLGPGAVVRRVDAASSKRVALDGSRVTIHLGAVSAGEERDLLFDVAGQLPASLGCHLSCTSFIDDFTGDGAAWGCPSAALLPGASSTALVRDHLVRDHRAAGVGERAVRHVPTGASGQYNEMLVARADPDGDSSIVQIGILQQWARVHLAQTLGEGAQQLTKEGPAMARARMVASEAEHWQRIGGARGDEVLDALGEVYSLPTPSPADCRSERGHTGGGEGEDRGGGR
jgi:hypothetical protein